ncbi:tumor necrosis factor receptor superfamily member 25 [Suncus etruscus]|uniref:tumor necrosis factor receptor superfamily member 25 n=1 Tax=Suncus etruscus TaxID=109475 RepID=UPI00210F9D53|nr:tumor necrosis factor receptor superfamily member 25 [Suncus etruscus]
MEPRPRVCAVLAAAMLLLGTPSVPCGDCALQSRPLNRGCPAGHFLQHPCKEPCANPTCTPCQPGFYMDMDNHVYEKCLPCRICDEFFSQVPTRNCSSDKNTECGCQPGWFVNCWDRDCKDRSFRCQPCMDYALPRHPSYLPPVFPVSPTPSLPAGSSELKNCGACLDGFYEHRNNCMACPTTTLGNCPKPCAAVCGWRQMFWVQVFLAVLVVPLLLGATLIYIYHRCRHARLVSAEEAGLEAPMPLQDAPLFLEENAHTALALPSSRKLSASHLVANSWVPSLEKSGPAIPWVKDWLPGSALGQAAPTTFHPIGCLWSIRPPPPPPPFPSPMPAHPAGPEATAALLQPGPQLYDVIDAVPARRWKEFVRTLGLREAEIEAVEVEVDRFRDQQYEMLKRWRQQESAGLGSVYRALERMGLDGCAEDLRGRLQRGA